MIRVPADIKAFGLKRRAKTLAELIVQAAEKDAFAIRFALFTVHGNYSVGLTYQCEAHGLVETSAGDVEIGIS